MKTLLLYTSHRQLEEVRLSSYFYNKSDFLKQMDVILHCNNEKIDKQKLKQNFDLFDAPNKEIIFSNKNSGHHSGVAQAIDSIYNKLLEYDFVVHLHPDVLILDPANLQATLEKNYNSDADFIVWQIHKTLGMPHGHERNAEYASDFFIFRPKEENNIFKQHADYWKGNQGKSGCERFLFLMIDKFNLITSKLDRDPVGGMLLSPEPFGLWHCHKPHEAVLYIEKDFKNA